MTSAFYSPLGSIDIYKLGGGIPIDIQDFTTSGTWTKPDDAQYVVVFLAHGGGGNSTGATPGGVSSFDGENGGGSGGIGAGGGGSGHSGGNGGPFGLPGQNGRQNPTVNTGGIGGSSPAGGKGGYGGQSGFFPGGGAGHSGGSAGGAGAGGLSVLHYLGSDIPASATVVIGAAGSGLLRGGAGAVRVVSY